MRPDFSEFLFHTANSKVEDNASNNVYNYVKLQLLFDVVYAKN